MKTRVSDGKIIGLYGISRKHMDLEEFLQEYRGNIPAIARQDIIGGMLNMERLNGEPCGSLRFLEVRGHITGNFIHALTRATKPREFTIAAAFAKPSMTNPEGRAMTFDITFKNAKVIGSTDTIMLTLPTLRAEGMLGLRVVSREEEKRGQLNEYKELLYPLSKNARKLIRERADAFVHGVADTVEIFGFRLSNFVEVQRTASNESRVQFVYAFVHSDDIQLEKERRH